MACRKYILTNTTNSNGVFSYQECSNQMWNYNILIESNTTLNVWLITGTYSTASSSVISVDDLGDFPFVIPPTPSVSGTGNVTPTPTPTPSLTPSLSVTSETPTPTPTTTLTETPTETPTGTPTPTTTLTETPTETPTPTTTLTETPTNTPTPTITPSQTPSFNFVVSNINTGSTYVQGVTGTTGTVATKLGYSYPVNQGEILYADFTTSGGNLGFDVEVKDPTADNFLLRVKINGSTIQTMTPGPGDIILTAGPYTITVSDILQVILENN